MTMTLTGSGGLFTRIGHLGGGLLDINALRGGAATARVLSGANLSTRVITTIAGDYANGTASPQVIDGYPTTYASYQQTIGSLPSTFQGWAQNTLRFMYGVDQLAVPATGPLSGFSNISLAQAVEGLIAQMLAGANYVTPATVTAGAQTAVGTPHGDAVIIVSLKNGLGQILQLPFPETLTFTCTQDSQSGATAGNEKVTILGQNAISDVLSQSYPEGSGVSTSVNAVNGASYNGNTGNLLVNSDFGIYTTTNYPDNWVISVGSAGTNVLNSGTPYTTGGGVLEFVGNGSTATAILQNFNTTSSTAAGVGGTPQTIVANAVYHFNGWIKVSAVPAAGTMEFALVDGSGTITQNGLAVDNKTLLNLATDGSLTYVPIHGAFQAPAVLPSQLAFRIRQSIAIENGKNAFIGRFSFARADNSGNGIYAGGPFVTVHSGNTILIDGQVPDQWTIGIANSYQTSGTGLMQLLMDRFFGLRTLATPALQLPYSGSNAVLDSLIA